MRRFAVYSTASIVINLFTKSIARHLRRDPVPPAWRANRRVRSPYHGVICVRLQGRWYGAWYEAYLEALIVASGSAIMYAHHVAGLPTRFQALMLLCKLARGIAHRG